MQTPWWSSFDAIDALSFRYLCAKAQETLFFVCQLLGWQVGQNVMQNLSRGLMKMRDEVASSTHQVAGFRLGRHNLAHRADRSDLAGIASRMCGAQAQVMSAAEISLGARLEGAFASDVRRELWGQMFPSG